MPRAACACSSVYLRCVQLSSVSRGCRCCAGVRVRPDAPRCTRRRGLTPAACHIRAGTGLATASSAHGPDSPRPHLRRDWAHPCPHLRRNCTHPNTLPHLRRDWAHPRPNLRRDWAHPGPHLRRDWAHPCHICAGTGLTPATSAPGLGLPRAGTQPAAGLPRVDAVSLFFVLSAISPAKVCAPRCEYSEYLGVSTQSTPV
jgi:hypothetical protein